MKNTNNILTRNLINLGLTENEISVYLFLLESGRFGAGSIIKNTKLPRNSVYLALDSLADKKIIAKTNSKNTALFEAANPEIFIDIEENKKNLAKKLSLELKNLQKRASRNIQIFEGMAGIMEARKKALELKPKDCIYLLGGSKFGSTEEMEKYWRRFHNKRIKNKIHFKILYDQTAPKEYAAWRANLPLTEVKYLPFDVQSPAWFEIYGDTVAIGIPGIDPLMIVFHSPESARGIKKYFDYFWTL